MTREEATDVLKEISATLKSWNGFTKYPQALDMAIEALSAPTGVDLISRQDALNYVDRITNSGCGRNKSLDYIRKYIERMDSARPKGDVVEVEYDHDYERASDMRDYCERYEPTYNPDDGSM